MMGPPARFLFCSRGDSSLPFLRHEKVLKKSFVNCKHHNPTLKEGFKKKQQHTIAPFWSLSTWHIEFR